MRRLVILVSAALFVVAAPAHARFGNPIKKAKEKLQKAVAPQATEDSAQGEDVTFDNVTVPLTEERVQNILSVYQKQKKQSDERAALVAQREAKSAERAKLEDREGAAMSKLRSKRMDVEGCYQEGYRKAQEQKMQEFAQRAASNDPALLAKYAKIAQQNNAAAAKGDSAATARGEEGVLAEAAPSHEDSVAIRASCGTIPPKSAAEVRAEQIDKQIADIDEQIRKYDERISKAQAKEGNLTEQQWSMAVERVDLYLAHTTEIQDAHARKEKGGGSGESGGGAGQGQGSQRTGSKNPPKVAGYSKAELEILDRYRDDLRAAMR